MTTALRLLVFTAMTLLVPFAASAAKPTPMPCPTDVEVAVTDACPCAGKMDGNGVTMPWKNHGQFVSCVVHVRNMLRKNGCLTSDLKRTMARCAARSTCGKTDTVLCCVTHTDTCVGDPAPGDMTKAGTCSNDATVACDVDADCTTVTASLDPDAATCTAAGGTATQGSVCSGCSVP